MLYWRLKTLEYIIGKFVLLMWYLYAMILIFAYSGNLRANLIVVNYEKPLRTIEDIANSERPLYMLDFFYWLKAG